MAPFPEAEDMTIKRLYVALKRSDMQLLQMGAHKLHEKFHTGHKFELLDDLRQILAYVEEQAIPNDVKDLLTRTITDILNGNAPYQEQKNEYAPYEQENPIHSYNSEFNPQESYSAPSYEQYQQVSSELLNINQNESPSAYNSIKNESSPIDIIYPETKPMPVIENAQEQTYLQHNNDTLLNSEENKPQEEQVQTSIPVQEIKEEAQEETISYENIQVEENKENEPEIKDEVQIENKQYGQPIQPESTPIINNTQEAENSKDNEIILEEKESTIENVAVFYDDKATVIDYLQNKAYRSEIDSITLKKEAHPLENASISKNIVDIPTDEINEIIKMLSTIKGDFYFITTSKSENIIKTFIDNYVNFEIPLVNEGMTGNKAAKLIPLFGLSNLFVCPKCGNKEYFGGIHNKVLSLQCKKCSSDMYPDIYEAENYETNANPYYWIKAMNSMAKADTWILINPPLENNRSLTAEFLKSSFEASKPKKVYILSKETTKKEYYKQLFKEINPQTEIKSDFITQDELCENFINNEMATLKVNI